MNFYGLSRMRHYGNDGDYIPKCVLPPISSPSHIYMQDIQESVAKKFQIKYSIHNR